MRDHFEGTDFDMTKGFDAGPFGSPRRWAALRLEARWRRIRWNIPVFDRADGVSTVTQSRAHLPNEIGGLVWFGMDDSYTSCYLPFYCSIESLPKSYTGGSIDKFSWDSAWWVFNVTANFAYGKYSYMMPDIRAAQRSINRTCWHSSQRWKRQPLSWPNQSSAGYPLPDRSLDNVQRDDRSPMAGVVRAYGHDRSSTMACRFAASQIPGGRLSGGWLREVARRAGSVAYYAEVARQADTFG